MIQLEKKNEQEKENRLITQMFDLVQLQKHYFPLITLKEIYVHTNKRT